MPQLHLPIGSLHVSLLITLLLLLSGQCPNPGPWPCGVCNRNVTWSGISFECTSCLKWVHRACCSLRNKRDYDAFNGAWRCPTCIQAQSPSAALSPPPPPPPSPPSSPPTPPSPPNPPNPPNQIQGHFLQFNTNGIQNSTAQILDLLTKHNILVACIQETKLTLGTPTPKFGRYAVERKDRATGGGGGLIILIHPDVSYTIADSSCYFNDPITEHQAIEVNIDDAKLLVINVYIPPASSVPGQTPDLTSIFNITRDVLIVGDFNAHDPRWHSHTQDTAAERRGDAICNALDVGQLMCINGPSHTRRPIQGRTSSPDLTFTNPHLGINARWEPLVTLNSDHLPIIIDLDGWFSSPPEPSGPSSYTNYRKANWNRFRQETERAFNYEQPPTSVDAGEKIFRRILLKASRRNIPQGKIQDYTPGLSPHALDLIQQRDVARATDPTNPEIALLDERIQRDCNKTKDEHWRKEVESCSIRYRPMMLWRLLQRLSGKKSFFAPNQPITFSGKSLSNRRDIATKFVKQFTRPTPHRQNPASRALIRQIRNKHRLDHSSMPFTPEQVKEALKESGSSTALSPDGLTVLQLKHLGPLGLRYLCRLFNLSYAHARIPDIWKHAIIVPLLKTGKPKEQGTSYRPISLLCPASKLMELLMLRFITPHLQLADTQHGFRAGRSTTTALLPLVHQVAAGFNQLCPPRRTVVMAVDFSKAFDTVDHTALLRSIHESTMDANTVRWLCTYLRGRTASCIYNGRESSTVIIHQGVPQGSRTSPSLFNFYVSSYPHTAGLVTSYADDFTAAASDKNVQEATRVMAEHATHVEAWAGERALQVSAQKSTVTLFTSERQQGRLHPLIPLGGSSLPLEQYPKILGVTFDPHFFFHKHVEALEKKAKQKLSLLKALTGTTWGQQKETLVATYKALIDSLFSYAAPVWFPNTYASNISKLQVIQNAALRIATGCPLMASVDHLHTEAEVLTVGEHLDMLCAQFLATCLQRHHPSFPTVTADSGPREKKQTLQRRYHAQVESFTGEDGAIVDAAAAREAIHHTAVEKSIRARGTNRVLGTPAPTISEEEEGLSRKTRRTLSQLRSGFCPALEDYRHRIGLSTNNLCPCCRQGEHSVQHLFECSAHLTDLEPLDLWTRPAETAEFLRTLHFSDLLEEEMPPGLVTAGGILWLIK